MPEAKAQRKKWRHIMSCKCVKMTAVSRGTPFLSLFQVANSRKGSFHHLWGTNFGLELLVMATNAAMSSLFHSLPKL